MSIGNIQSHHPGAPRAVPPAPGGRSPADSPSAALFDPRDGGTGNSGQPASATSVAAVAPAHFQSLASDIQALLIRAQSSGITPAAGGTTPSASSTAAAPGPEQKLATDLQSVMNDLRTSASPGGHNPTTGRAESHRHHNHHHNGGANATASGSPREGPSSTASNGNGAVSQVFAADVVKALRAYGGGIASGTTAGVTA